MLKFKVMSIIFATTNDLKLYEHHFDVNKLEVDENNAVAFKLAARLGYFYVSPSVYKRCVAADMVWPMDGSEERESMTTNGLICGLYTTFYRLTYSLEQSTFPYLKIALKALEQQPKKVMVKEFDTEWVRVDPSKPSTEEELQVLQKEPRFYRRSQMEVDLEKFKVENQKFFEGKQEINRFCTFEDATTYATFLKALASAIDRTLLNTENLYDALKEAEFYDVDYFMQRTTKFELLF